MQPVALVAAMNSDRDIRTIRRRLLLLLYSEVLADLTFQEQTDRVCFASDGHVWNTFIYAVLQSIGT